MMVLWLTHYLCAYTDEQEFQKEKEGKKYLQTIGNWKKWSAIWSDITCIISQSNRNAAQVDLRSQVWFWAKILRHKVTLFNQFWNCKVSFTSYIVRLSHEKAPHRNPKITIVCVHFPWDNLYLPMKFTFLCIKMYFFYLRGLWNTVIVNESLMNMNKNSQMINGFGLLECGHHKWQWWCSSTYDNSDERSCRGTCDFYFGLFL